MKSKYKENLAAYLFLLPTIIIFLSLVLIPLLSSFVLSFTKWNFISGLKGIKFVGFDNFIKLAKDDYFVSAIKNTLVYTITTVPIIIAVSLGLAYILNGKIYFKKTMRLAFFIPYVCSAVAVSVVFKMLFREDGPINMVLQNVFNVENLPRWFSDGNINK